MFLRDLYILLLGEKARMEMSNSMKFPSYSGRGDTEAFVIYKDRHKNKFQKRSKKICKRK